MIKVNPRGMRIALPLLAVALVGGLYIRGRDRENREWQMAGTTLLLAPDTNSPNWPSELREQRNVLNRCRMVMQKRLSNFKFTSTPRVDLKQDAKIEVFLPDTEDHTKAQQLITSGARLEIYLLSNIQTYSNPQGKWRMNMPLSAGRPYVFISPGGVNINTEKEPDIFMSKIVGKPAAKPVLDNRDILPNAATVKGLNDYVTVDIEFNDEAKQSLASLTRSNVGKNLAIVFGKKLLMAPEIASEITDGKSQISGFADVRDAEFLASIINSGPLDVGFNVISKTITEQNE